MRLDGPSTLMCALIGFNEAVRLDLDFHDVLRWCTGSILASEGGLAARSIDDHRHVSVFRGI